MNWLTRSDQDYQSHNNLYIALGTFILWVSWFFFNGGSAYTLYNERKNGVPKIILNTTLAASIGGLVAVALKPRVMRTYSKIHKFDVGTICNGCLAGLVSITAPCDNVEPWAAIIIGIIGAIFYVLFCKFLDALKIDDPVEASAVHFAGGVWGVIASGFFDMDLGVFYGKDGSGEFFGY